MPKISIVMPVYNQAEYAAETIESVLAQTFGDWELVIVDDGSTDGSAERILRYSDSRIRYFYQRNRGVSAARNLALEEARGEFVGFLDADDTFFPRKIEEHISCLERDSTIGLTYSSRITVDQDGARLALIRAPSTSKLEDLVLSFPFAPTDMVVRRQWLQQTGAFDEMLVVNEDRDLYIRLALNGCRFHRVDKFLATRRLYTQRIVRDLTARMDDMLHALETAFADPRCPRHILALSDLAHRNVFLSWAYQASIQDEGALARTYFSEALRFDRSLSLHGKDGDLLNILIHSATRDSGDHAVRLRKVSTYMSPEISIDSELLDWAIGQGYLIKGTRDLLWGRAAQAESNIAAAMEMGAEMDRLFVEALTEQLLNYQAIYGSSAGQKALERMVVSIQRHLPQRQVRRFVACYSINSAFRSYNTSAYREVTSQVATAVVNSPLYVLNRGVLSIFFRSLPHLYK